MNEKMNMQNVKNASSSPKPVVALPILPANWTGRGLGFTNGLADSIPMIPIGIMINPKAPIPAIPAGQPNPSKRLSL